MSDQLLHSGWVARRASDVRQSGAEITSAAFQPSGWLPAVVPGTVLTTLMQNDRSNQYPDPYFGLNSRFDDVDCQSAPSAFRNDISATGAAAYTYWFYNSFPLPKPPAGRRVWLEFRGINESGDAWLNGHRLNGDTLLRGMFLRHLVDVTSLLDAGGTQRLAVLVAPPAHYGTPGGNGGQAPTEMGREVTMRYTVGWDWIIPMPDRNTGLWDQVSLRETGPLLLRDPHVVVEVAEGSDPLRRDAAVRVGIDLYNGSGTLQNGTLICRMNGIQRAQRPFSVLRPGPTTFWFDPFVEKNAALWWPNGFGPQPLYSLELEVRPASGDTSDVLTRSFGMRQVKQTTTRVNDNRRDVDARTFVVNGRPLFLRGGNWIGTDARLRLSRKRYDDEVRFYAGTGLSMLRVWGGGIAERPEFYEACDRYGIVVMQDFWLSSEYLNRDDETEFIAVFKRCAEDAIRMLRAHPSLIFWCGANECDPPPSLDAFLRETIASVDGTRGYVANSKQLSSDSVPPYEDGPYGLLDPVSRYFEHPMHLDPTPPFNPEIGALGQPVLETLQLTMPQDHLEQHPRPRTVFRCDIHEDWYWHSFSQFYQDDGLDQVYAYGDDAKTIERYAFYAQLVSLVQYQALIEGHSNRMWRWYTGVLIWKAQNPWPGLRAALYDWYLDQTGGYFGVKRATRAVHVQLDLRGGTGVAVVNQSPEDVEAKVEVTFYRADGVKEPCGVFAGTAKSNSAVTLTPPIQLPRWPVVFVHLRLTASNAADESFYWLPVTARDFTSLRSVPAVALSVTARGRTVAGRHEISVTLKNGTPSPALWIRLKMLDGNGQTRILPVHYSDNYVCVMPNDTRAIDIDYAIADNPHPGLRPQLWLEGYNAGSAQVPIQWS